MNRRHFTGSWLGVLALIAYAPVAMAALTDTTRVVDNPAKYGMVVSSTRTLKDALDVPATVDVVRGETLRRHGARTLADALQDVTGLDLGDGSDNGSRLPNIGVWGLKEFDALLVSVDGIPVGGPFNPALIQVPIEDIDRIEISRGPQGTLYGLSAFAGMVQVYTRPAAGSGAEFTQQVSSFNGVDGGFSWNGKLPDGTSTRLAGSAGRGDGWQDRTAFTRFRSTMTFARAVGRGRASLQLIGAQDRQEFGTPVPYEAGKLVPGFDPRRNEAVLGARTDHLVFGASGALTWPMGPNARLESNLGVTSDRQDLVRSFVDSSTLAGDSVDADGQRFKPVETTAYFDVRAIRTLEFAGAHEWVTGAAVTVGKLRAEGGNFDFNVKRLPVPLVPDVNHIANAENVDAEDMRTLVGAFAHDSWSPHARVAVTAGGRVDLANEELETGDIADGNVSKDSRQDTGWSADGGLLFRMLPPAPSGGAAANLFGNLRRNFKPAAPNVFEAEGSKILEPERSVAWEGGIKAQALDGQVSLGASVFRMDLENQVITVLTASNNPGLANAGHTRFRGEEVTLRLAPDALAGLSLAAGYAHHDPRFVTFTRPNGAFVNGKQVELAPRELWNAGASWAGPHGVSAWVAARGAGERPLNKRNTFYAAAYHEWDAGAGIESGGWRVSVAGRNLGDSRHLVGESEIGDSQFYVAPPRRVSAQLTVRM